MKLSDIKEEELSSSNSADFLKLKVGDNRVRIVSEFAKKESHYRKGECLGDGCPFCAQGDKPGTRYLCYVIDRGDNAIKAAEFGITVMKQLRALSLDDEYKFDIIPGYDVNIKREGTTKEDTKYTIIPNRSNTDLTETEKQEVEKLKSPSDIILAMIRKTKEKQSSPAKEEVQLEDIPF